MQSTVLRPITTALVVALAASACGPDDEPAPRADAAPVAMTQPATQPGVAPIPPNWCSSCARSIPC